MRKQSSSVIKVSAAKTSAASFAAGLPGNPLVMVAAGGADVVKTAWYPLVKRVGAVVGKQVTKKTVEKMISKAVPVIGGIVSGGLTYV